MTQARCAVGPCVTTVRTVGEKVAHPLPSLWGHPLLHIVQYHVPTLQHLLLDFLNRQARTVPPQNQGIQTASAKWCHTMVVVTKLPLGQLLDADSISKMHERLSKRGVWSYETRSTHLAHLCLQHSYQIQHSPPLRQMLASRHQMTWLRCSIPLGF